MTNSLRTPQMMKTTTPSAAPPTRFRAQAGRRVLLRFLDDEEGNKIEGALRHANDDEIEFWSRVACRRVEQPRPVMVSVLLEAGLWVGTGMASQSTKLGAVMVHLDQPLVPGDRRRHPRYQVAWPMSVMLGQHLVTGTAVDISVGGVRFSPDQGPWPQAASTGTWVAVSIGGAARSGEGSFLGLAVVRASDDELWRMEFTDIPQRMSDILSNAIRLEAKAGASVAL